MSLLGCRRACLGVAGFKIVLCSHKVGIVFKLRKDSSRELKTLCFDFPVHFISKLRDAFDCVKHRVWIHFCDGRNHID
jgi:hypothetical protein